jgi:hypothetical protein
MMVIIKINNFNQDNDNDCNNDSNNDSNNNNENENENRYFILVLLMIIERMYIINLINKTVMAYLL